MSNLVSIIVALALGAIIIIASTIFLGNIFSEQSVKAEAQKALNQIDQINGALLAYTSFNNNIKIGFSDPNNDGDYSDSQVFRALEEDEWLKNSSSLIDGGGYFLDKTTMAFSKIIQDETICVQVNHIRNKYPKEGLSVGYTVEGIGAITANDLVGNLPKCGTAVGNVSVCCAKE